MATFDVAKLLNKITQDIPGINTVLKALAKWDVSALSDVPDGAMQATTDASNRLTIKKKISGSYVNVGQLQHSADMVDGYHASTSATANTVAVRNASGALPGNILGNAATAGTATALAAGSVVPVNQGGTGATTASQARANLGVADGTEFTAHITKQASPSVEGHVKLDALAADGSNTAAPGGYGLGVGATIISDWNVTLKPGWYGSFNTALNVPMNAACRGFIVCGANASNGYQIVFAGESNTGRRIFTRRFSNGTFAETWVELPNGITDDTNTASSTVAASATAVKAVNDAASDAQTDASTALARTAPATTTSRGIGRVATLADMAPGATVENGPAVIDAKGGVITPTPTAHAVPRAGADGRLTPGFIPGLFVGDIRLLPFRATDLATYCRGWHFCNGDQYALTSPVGSKLNSLPTGFKADWGITVSGGNISIPKLFYSDGRGYFLRAVDGTGRIVGGIEQDTLQGHRHDGSFASSEKTKGGDGGGWNNTYSNAKVGDPTTDTVNDTPRISKETRPINVGMTPAIFLDV